MRGLNGLRAIAHDNRVFGTHKHAMHVLYYTAECGRAVLARVCWNCAHTFSTRTRDAILHTGTHTIAHARSASSETLTCTLARHGAHVYARRPSHTHITCCQSKRPHACVCNTVDAVARGICASVGCCCWLVVMLLAVLLDE